MKNLYILFIIAISMIVLSCSGQVFEPIFNCTSKLDDAYGVCCHTEAGYTMDYRNSLAKKIDSAGIDIVRMDFRWSSLQLDTLEPLNVQRVKDMITPFKSRVIEVLPILDYEIKQVEKPYENLPQWDKYVSTVAILNKGVIRQWEVWNEPNVTFFWHNKPNINEYFSLLANTNKVLKNIDKKNRVLLAGIPILDPKFIKSAVECGVDKYADIYNIHIYCHGELPEDCIIENAKKAFDLFNKTYKHIWLTETGLSTAGQYKVTEDEQAYFLPRIYLISFALGFDKVFWYDIIAAETKPNERQDHFGLLHNDMGSRPSYFALKNLTTICPNKSSRPTLRKNRCVYISEWTTPMKKHVIGVWSTEAKGEYPLIFNKKVKAVDYMGNDVNVDATHFVPTGKIVYFIGNKNLKLMNY
jgi:polysaccharide biosynthesis protein PslG